MDCLVDNHKVLYLHVFSLIFFYTRSLLLFSLKDQVKINIINDTKNVLHLRMSGHSYGNSISIFICYSLNLNSYT